MNETKREATAPLSLVGGGDGLARAAVGARVQAATELREADRWLSGQELSWSSLSAYRARVLAVAETLAPLGESLLLAEVGLVSGMER